jgi:hypothetical protein
VDAFLLVCTNDDVSVLKHIRWWSKRLLGIFLTARFHQTEQGKRRHCPRPRHQHMHQRHGRSEHFHRRKLFIKAHEGSTFNGNPIGRQTSRNSNRCAQRGGFRGCWECARGCALHEGRSIGIATNELVAFRQFQTGAGTSGRGSRIDGEQGDCEETDSEDHSWRGIAW